MHTTIVVVDVVSFTDPARTMIHQLVVRESLHNVLRGAFFEAGFELDTCVVKDRGDGMLILLPPGADKHRLVDQLPSRLVAWLRRNNTIRSAETQMKLRVALHHGEARQHGQGVLGGAVNLGLRMVNAPEAKLMLRSTPYALALIASDDFYQTVIVQDPAADPGSYRQFSVSVDKSSVVAWLRLVDAAAMWELDIDRSFPPGAPLSVAYTTAKIVLVGESGVGKTGLGWRLAYGEFVEHSSTHGQQFWRLDQLSGTTVGDIEREAILWDLAGQPDYRLIHALSLDDADLALVLFDPTLGDDPLRGVEYWLRQIRRDCPIILVAARSDRGIPRLTAEEVEAFCVQRGIAGYVVTSALRGDGLDELVDRMHASIRWNKQPTTLTTQIFKYIKDYVLDLKDATQGEEIILSPAQLRAQLEKRHAAIHFTNAELMTAVRHLSNHGYVAELRTSRGELQILFTPVLLNNLAASIILEARRNSKGLGALEEQLLYADAYHFPELAALSTGEREVLLDSAVAMFWRIH